MNSLKSLRLLTVLMPLLSVIVSAGIVGHQYARQASLARDIAATERQVQRLEKAHPEHPAPAHCH